MHSKAEVRRDAASSSERIEVPACSARSLSIHLYHRSFYSLRQFSGPTQFCSSYYNIMHRGWRCARSVPFLQDGYGCGSILLLARTLSTLLPFLLQMSVQHNNVVYMVLFCLRTLMNNTIRSLCIPSRSTRGPSLEIPSPAFSCHVRAVSLMDMAPAHARGPAGTSSDVQRAAA